MGPMGPAGPTGPAGATGPQGPPGASPELTALQAQFAQLQSQFIAFTATAFGRAYVTDTHGTLSVINTFTNTVIKTIAFGSFPRSARVPVGHKPEAVVVEP